MRATAFGLPLDVRFPVPGLVESEIAGAVPVVIRLGTSTEGAAWWGDGAEFEDIWTTTFPDGEIVKVAQRSDGAQQFSYGSVATFYIAADATSVISVPLESEGHRWQRFLLDTVLWWVSSMRGFFLLHAAAVVVDDGVVAVASRTGGGKTTLLLELLRRGHRLVSDDIVALDTASGRIRAHPAPRLVMAPTHGGPFGDLGVAIAAVGDETLLEVEQSVIGAQPLRAVVLYDRRAGASLSAGGLTATPLDILPHVWDVRGDADRTRDRFEFLARLIRETPLIELRAPIEASPRTIVDRLMAALKTSEPAPWSSGG